MTQEIRVTTRFNTHSYMYETVVHTGPETLETVRGVDVGGFTRAFAELLERKCIPCTKLIVTVEPTLELEDAA